MKNKLLFSRSSFLVSLPMMVGSLLLCVLAAFFQQRELAAVLIFLFLMALTARLWAFASMKNVSVRIMGATQGMFPSETVQVEVEVHNGKFLPIVWLDVFFPLARDLCLTPEVCRKPDEWETPGLEEEKASQELVGEQRFSFFMWYETVRFTTNWTANRRGTYSTRGWRLRTGDGFGLAQVERGIGEETPDQFAVYPKLVRVKPDLFLRNLWNADTGTRGVMEDPTVIRSTRDYMTTDALKHINWRLAARGLPIAVNVYEDILPKNVHFLFDGESFGGPEPRWEEMEEALSILGSEFVRLEAAQVQCGLSLCQGESGKGVNLFNAGSAQALLHALAGYQPMPPVRDSENNKIIKQEPVFHEGPIYEAAQRIGRFYYVVYDLSSLPTSKLLQRLDHTVLTILTYEEAEAYGEYEVVGLRRLKEGEEYG